VTTVDVYIKRVGGPGSLSLHNGLFGPATSALHALIRAFQDGTLAGPWHSTYIDTTAPGTVVRSVLAGIDDQDPELREDDRARLASFREEVDDAADYSIKAIEA
jgi:hypothetical protein